MDFLHLNRITDKLINCKTRAVLSNRLECALFNLCKRKRSFAVNWNRMKKLKSNQRVHFLRRALKTSNKNGEGGFVFLAMHDSFSSFCNFFYFSSNIRRVPFRSVKFKGLPVRHDASNSERTFKKNYWTSFESFTSVTCGFHFWINWEPKWRDKIHRTVLSWSSATGLESPKSLASDIASSLD